MFRTPAIAALALTLMGSAAFAQDNAAGAPNGPPAQLSGGNPSDDDRGPPPSSGNQGPPPGNAQAQEQRRDMFCRRDAAARTGYVTPGQAASREQTNGSVGGTVAGAALGAAIGSASHAAGAGALIGAGAGLIAGTAIGADNAQHASSDVERAYADAYDACMTEADDRGPPDGQYAYGPPPPGYYAPYPYPYPYYYPPYYYGPAVSFGFGFGGYHGFHGGGFRGGFRH